MSEKKCKHDFQWKGDFCEWTSYKNNKEGKRVINYINYCNHCDEWEETKVGLIL